MRKRQAWNAASRCGLATAITTEGSPTFTVPTRCAHSIRTVASRASSARQRAKMRSISGAVIASNASYSRRTTGFSRFTSRVVPMNTVIAPHDG
jgi:hypothetical protein